MNPPEIAALAYRAGVTSQSDLQAAIAIAMAESGGNPNAEGDKHLQTKVWGPSVGLWQIRSLKAESGKGSVRDATRLKDPTFNAASMFNISKGGKNWGAWTTWPLRAAPYMPAAATAAAAVRAATPTVDGITETVEGVASGLDAVGTGVMATHGWISDRNNWLRVAKVGVGAIVVGGSIYAVVSNTQVAKTAVGVAKTVATKGKA